MMFDKVVSIYRNLEWISEQMDDLHNRINDYIFDSCCDIDPTKVNVKKLDILNKECDELKARYEKEIREFEKIS